jgi:metal-responsive CopG/Arc/MetJ family transcriptional regulator
MHRPRAQEFLQTVLETLDDVPPELARRFDEILKREGVDRSQAIRELFEELAGD